MLSRIFVSFVRGLIQTVMKYCLQQIYWRTGDNIMTLAICGVAKNMKAILCLRWVGKFC